jgi:hypothetical protein
VSLAERRRIFEQGGAGGGNDHKVGPIPRAPINKISAMFAHPAVEPAPLVKQQQIRVAAWAAASATGPSAKTPPTTTTTATKEKAATTPTTSKTKAAAAALGLAFLRRPPANDAATTADNATHTPSSATVTPTTAGTNNAVLGTFDGLHARGGVKGVLAPPPPPPPMPPTTQRAKAMLGAPRTATGTQATRVVTPAASQAREAHVADNDGGIAHAAAVADTAPVAAAAATADAAAAPVGADVAATATADVAPAPPLAAAAADVGAAATADAARPPVAAADANVIVDEQAQTRAMLDEVKQIAADTRAMLAESEARATLAAQVATRKALLIEHARARHAALSEHRRLSATPHAAPPPVDVVPFHYYQIPAFFPSGVDAQAHVVRKHRRCV